METEALGRLLQSQVLAPDQPVSLAKRLCLSVCLCVLGTAVGVYAAWGCGGHGSGTPWGLGTLVEASSGVAENSRSSARGGGDGCTWLSPAWERVHLRAQASELGEPQGGCCSP